VTNVNGVAGCTISYTYENNALRLSVSNGNDYACGKFGNLKRRKLTRSEGMGNNVFGYIPGVYRK
jgi:hypothetical protein